MSDAPVPEFHLVVRRPSRRGPLAPYRFPISVVFGLVIAGRRMLTAAGTGIGVDESMLVFGASTSFAWVLVGLLSKILGSVEQRSTTVADSDTTDAADPG